MKDGTEEVNIVEVYGGNILHPPEIVLYGMDPTKPFFQVEDFHRAVFCREELTDMLVEQTILSGVKYAHFSVLPLEATNNRKKLFEAINELPPLLAGHVSDNTWTGVAAGLAEYSEQAFGGTPFAVIGDEAFGRVELLLADRGWQSRRWDKIAKEIDKVDRCALCLDEYDLNDEKHLENVIGFLCQYVYHKCCILPYIWEWQVYNARRKSGNHVTCPICSTKLC